MCHTLLPMLEFSHRAAVTLVFTDIEGSTLLWEHFGEGFLDILDLHNRLMRTAIEAHGGYEVKTEGDAFMVAFSDPLAAVQFGLDAQRRLHEANWPEALHAPGIAALSGTSPDGTFRGLRVRMGIHTGTPVEREDPVTGRSDFFGPDVNRAARLSSAGHGGQLLVSDATWTALGAMDLVVVEDLGEHALRGLESREHIRQLLPSSLSSRRFPKLKTPELRKTNLPARVDSFIGRADALAELGCRVENGQHLITIQGTGGLGKTRLAQRFAAEQLEHFPGGVWFCDLSEARSFEAFIRRVGHAIGSPLDDADAITQLGHTLAQRRRVLLVLDNFEQIVDAAARAVASWMLHAPEAVFIVTSRIRLNIAGEHIYNLSPHDFEEAIQLFEERAQAGMSGFALNADNRLAVEGIVTKLDGIALAVELAAARVQLLPPAQILERLGQRFRLLRARRRDRTARQTTLQGAIDWSWELLEPWEQQALAQCSVFRGGFDLKAAEAVLDLGDSPEVIIDVIESLMDHSLLHTRESKVGEVRVGLFESIQAYAAQKLEGGESASALRLKHARYYAELGSDAELAALYSHQSDPDQHPTYDSRSQHVALSGGADWGALNRLLLEGDNLTTALDWALGAGALPEAVHLARALQEVAKHRGPLTLVQKRVDHILTLPGLSAPARMDLTARHAEVMILAGDMETAKHTLLQLLDEAKGLEEPRLLAIVSLLLGTMETYGQSPNAARPYLEAASEAAHVGGDDLVQATAMMGLGNLEQLAGRPEAAEAIYRDAIVRARRYGNIHLEGVLVGHLATLDMHRGQLEAALASFRLSLASMRRVGARRHVGATLANIGAVYLDMGRLTDARKYLDDALAVHREVGARRPEGVTLLNLGTLCLAVGDGAAAEVYYLQSIAIHEGLGNQGFAAMAGGNIAEVYLRAGRLKKAEGYVAQAIATCAELGLTLYLGVFLGLHGQIQEGLGAPDAADRSLDESEALLRRSGQAGELGKLLCRKGNVLERRGDMTAARAALKEASALAQQIEVTTESELGAAVAELSRMLAQGDGP